MPLPWLFFGPVPAKVKRLRNRMYAWRFIKKLAPLFCFKKEHLKYAC